MFDRFHLDRMRENLWTWIEAARPISADDHRDLNESIGRLVELEKISALWEIRDELRNLKSANKLASTRENSAK